MSILASPFYLFPGDSSPFGGKRREKVGPLFAGNLLNSSICGAYFMLNKYY